MVHWPVDAGKIGLFTQALAGGDPRKELGTTRGTSPVPSRSARGMNDQAQSSQAGRAVPSHYARGMNDPVCTLRVPTARDERSSWTNGAARFPLIVV